MARKITMQDMAVMSVQYVQYTFDYYLDSLQKCGLSKVDMWGGAPHYSRLDYNTSMEAAKRIREMRKNIEDRGMKVVMYTPETLGYPYSYSNPDFRLRARTVDYMRNAMDDALEFGTNMVFLNTGCAPRNLPREDGLKRTIDSYRIMADYAEKMGVQLVLEQLQPYESNLCLTLGDVKHIIDAVDSPNLGCCVDLVAMEVAGETLEQFCDTLGDKIQWIHYSDSHHLILGDGDYGKEKLAGWIKLLEDRGYQNCIDLEINDSIYWEDPHTSIARTAEYLRTYVPEK